VDNHLIYLMVNLQRCRIVQKAFTIIAPDAACLCARVLSSILTIYGAAAAQTGAIYENFRGKCRSVLLANKLLFSCDYIEKRKDLVLGY
jgi:hypothetical protein